VQTDTLPEGSCLTDPVRRVITCRRSRGGETHQTLLIGEAPRNVFRCGREASWRATPV